MLTTLTLNAFLQLWRPHKVALACALLTLSHLSPPKAMQAAAFSSDLLKWLEHNRSTPLKNNPVGQVEPVCRVGPHMVL